MKRILAAAVSVTLLVSCANPSKQTVPARAEDAALLAALDVKGNPARMPDADRVTFEAVAVRIVSAGSRMVAPILADVESNRDRNRREVLARLLVMIDDRMAADSSFRADADKKIETTAHRMLSSSDASDRYWGAVLTALPAKSQLVSAALKLLEDEDADNRDLANTMLREIAGIDLGYNPDAAPADRAGAVKRWHEWWAKNKDRAYYYMASSNPILAAAVTESKRVASQAGPYQILVTDASDAPLEGAVVVYSYYFTTYDGRGEKTQQRLATDANGRALLGAESVAPGMNFIGAQIVVSKTGYRQLPVRLSPHILTPNSFSIAVSLEAEKK